MTKFKKPLKNLSRLEKVFDAIIIPANLVGKRTGEYYKAGIRTALNAVHNALGPEVRALEKVAKTARDWIKATDKYNSREIPNSSEFDEMSFRLGLLEKALEELDKIEKQNEKENQKRSCCRARS